MTISDEAMEAAAAFYWDNHYKTNSDPAWRDAVASPRRDDEAGQVRDMMRSILEAAAPHLMAQALTEAARSFSESTPEGEYASSPEQVIAWMREYADLYRSAGAGG
jgi:hypothetical protein